MLCIKRALSLNEESVFLHGGGYLIEKDVQIELAIYVNAYEEKTIRNLLIFGFNSFRGQEILMKRMRMTLFSFFIVN